MSGRPREMPESFGELFAPGAEAKPGFAALEEENSLLRPLSPPPPEAQPRLPPEGSRWPRGCARCGGGFPVLLRSCAPASPGVKRENKNKTKKKNQKSILRGFGISARAESRRLGPAAQPPGSVNWGHFAPKKALPKAAKKGAAGRGDPLLPPRYAGILKPVCAVIFPPISGSVFPPIYAVIFPSFQAVFLPPLSNVFPL